MSGPGTPLPWVDFTAGIGEANGASIATLWRDGAERTANAAFIVRACNNHDALLEALEGLYGAIDSCVELTPRTLDKARAAIAAATDAGS